MMYASNKAWREMDRLQKLQVPYQSKVIAVQIQNFQSRYKGYGTIIDLGCGTGQLIAKALSLCKTHRLHYYGIDFDTVALKIARSETQWPIVPLHFKNSSVFEINTFNNPINKNDGRLFLSLSNTLLSFGSRKQVGNLLQNISKGKCTEGLFSVIPWDAKRKEYHRCFENWIFITEFSDDYRIRNQIKTSKCIVSQEVYIQPTSCCGFKIKHNFLKLDCDEIEIFFKQHGWKVCQWINPWSGQTVKPSDIEIPEFYLKCVAI